MSGSVHPHRHSNICIRKEDSSQGENSSLYQRVGQHQSLNQSCLGDLLNHALVGCANPILSPASVGLLQPHTGRMWVLIPLHPSPVRHSTTRGWDPGSLGIRPIHYNFSTYWCVVVLLMMRWVKDQHNAGHWGLYLGEPLSKLDHKEEDLV